LLVFGFIFFAFTIFAAINNFFNSQGRSTMDAKLPHQTLQIISPAFKDNAEIPAQYTCKGQNVSPPLNILGAQKAAKTLVLIMHDPDAVGSDFTHWLMWDIPTSTEAIAANSVPVGAVQGLNDGGGKQYTGPCPPAGTGVHHYKFELYALDKVLSLDNNTGRQDLQAAMNGHIIDRSILTGTFATE
jgi:Raf kinase inhibitor-like YbhB/YbcL family protein